MTELKSIEGEKKTKENKPTMFYLFFLSDDTQRQVMRSDFKSKDEAFKVLGTLKNPHILGLIEGSEVTVKCTFHE